jgi:hypothetical protein
VPERVSQIRETGKDAAHVVIGQKEVGPPDLEEDKHGEDSADHDKVGASGRKG